mgnify:CR=1 FL=1
MRACHTRVYCASTGSTQQPQAVRVAGAPTTRTTRRNRARTAARQQAKAAATASNLDSPASPQSRSSITGSTPTAAPESSPEQLVPPPPSPANQGSDPLLFQLMTRMNGFEAELGELRPLRPQVQLMGSELGELRPQVQLLGSVVAHCSRPMLCHFVAKVGTRILKPIPDVAHTPDVGSFERLVGADFGSLLPMCLLGSESGGGI